MLSFAMFQRKLAKIIWSISIVLHILVLFMWDYSYVWIILLFGVSALLLFQIVYSKKLWQRNYYEHIIRNEKKLNKIRGYILNNPLKWQLDRENPERIGNDKLEDEIFNISK